MPVLYIPYKSKFGFQSPGFRVSSTGNIESDESLTVSGNVTLSQTLSSTGNLTTTQSFIGNNLQLSSIAIEGNSIRTSITNQDLLLSVDGTGTIKLQEAVEITGVLTTTDTTDASSTTDISVIITALWRVQSQSKIFQQSNCDLHILN